MILVFDLDGTLCDTVHDGTRWLYEVAEPYPARIARVNQLYDAGHTILIDSARGCTSGKNWSAVTVAQLRRWGVRYHKVRTGQKWGADVYIDDRAMHAGTFFNGGFGGLGEDG